MPSHLEVDLALPPQKRWALSEDQREHAGELLDVYLRDLSVDDAMLALLASSAAAVVPSDYHAEMSALADTLQRPLAHVLAGNLYYDALKVIWGCTAFAVDTDHGPIHARNLDWGTENRVLNDHTVVTAFKNAPAGSFTTIGWPGFVGVLSGVAAARFSVSLNAVLSDDPAKVDLPVVFLLRQVLEQAESFDQAVQMLTDTPIASDCLLLVAGPHRGQMCVIERTPNRHAVRHPTGGAVFATNDYLSLDANAVSTVGNLHATACGRRERIEQLVRTRRPANLQSCLQYLADSDVRMLITVQQMAFNPRNGEFLLRIP